MKRPVHQKTSKLFGQFVGLRQRAEAELRGQMKEPKSNTDTQRLLHELQVHQIELEMQNAELRKTRDEREVALQNFSDLYDFAPFGYFTLTAAGVINQVNLTGTNLVGMERSRLLGRSFGMLVVPELRPVFHAFLKKVLASEAKVSIELEFLGQPGKPRRAVNLEARRLLNGQECRVAVVDITERKRGEEKVRVSEIRYRRLFEAAHDGVLLLNPGTRKITDANPFMTKLLGYSHAQLVGKELFEIGLLKDEAASQEMFQKLKRQHEVRYENLPLESQAGRHQEVEVVANLYQEDGRAVIQCNIRDITERKAAADALRASEERYRNLFNSMDEGYCIVELIFDKRQKPVDYRFLEVNPAFEKLTGLHGALGKRVSEFVPDLEAYWYETYGKVARTGEPIRVAQEAKGMNRWFDIYAFRIGGNASRKVAILFNNITEHKQAEAALRQSEDRYRTLFASIDEGFCVVELIFDKRQKPVDYRFLEVNPTFERQTGLLKAVGKRMRELVPDIESHWIEIYGQVALTGESIRFMNEAKAMGGRWFDAYACRVGGAESRKVAIVFNDITQRKQTEQELSEKARLLDLSHDAIIVRDLAGHIRYWNHGATELYGWSRQEALGKVSHVLLQTEFPVPLEKMVAELYRTDRWIGELVHTSRAGRRITVLARKTLDRDRAGRPAAVLENLTDITQRKTAEEVLRRSEALFSTLIGQAPVGVYVVDAQFRLQQANPLAQVLFSKIDPLIGRDFSEILHILWPQRAAAAVLAHFRRTLKTGVPYQSPEFNERRQDTGTREIYEWQIQRVTLPAGELGLVCFFSNVTQRRCAEQAQRRIAVLAASNQKLAAEISRRKLVEAALKKTEQHQRELLAQSRRMQTQLRELSHQVLHAQEEERKRISRELHDVIAQTLTGINIRLAALKKQAANNSGDIERDIGRTQRLVERSVNLVHAFARELRPAVLDDLGLIPALHSFVKLFCRRTRVRVDLTAFAGVEKLDINKRTIFYRVAQEALNNVSRHAAASRVEVSIQKNRAAGIGMKIHDNGKSFIVDGRLETKGKKRLGLLGMRERVEMVGGTFCVESAPGKGTTIQVEIPFGKLPAPQKNR